MNSTDRILDLCKSMNCCPLGLAGWFLPYSPWWMPDREYGWKACPSPMAEQAAEWLQKDLDDCLVVTRFWDGLGDAGAIPIERLAKSKRRAVRRALALGIFSHPAKLTSCERKWLDNPLRYGAP